MDAAAGGRDGPMPLDHLQEIIRTRLIGSLATLRFATAILRPDRLHRRIWRQIDLTQAMRMVENPRLQDAIIHPDGQLRRPPR